MLVDNPDAGLMVEGVAAAAIAAEHGTPVYVYSAAAILGSYRQYEQALRGTDYLICVSVKANSNLSLLHLLAAQGAGFDVVSGGELQRVVAAGGDPAKTVFAGVGKTDDEIEQALRAGILMLNVESAAELERIDQIARNLGLKAPVALRVNPNIDARTHPYISTGMAEHKFGIPLEDAANLYRQAPRLANLSFVGVDCHIGSMITDLSVFDEALAKIAEFVSALAGGLPDLKYLDIGGGLGIRYKEETPPDIDAFAGLVRDHCGPLGLRVILEPGRSLFANAGVLITKVLYTKPGGTKVFVIVDAGFNDLIRPALYSAYHDIVPLSPKNERGTEEPVLTDIVGPICESSDCFAKGRLMPQFASGDLLAIRSAGAYGFVMSSNYNTRPRPPEVLVSGQSFKVIRPRERVEDLYESEIAPLSGLRDLTASR